MILCRTCRSASPDDAQFCEKCGRSFDLRHCPAKHRSSIDASFCAACGSHDLTEPTRCLRLGTWRRLALIVLAIVGLGLAFPYLLGFVSAGYQSLAQLILGTWRCYILDILFHFACVWFTIWLCLRLISGPKSKLLKAYTGFTKRFLKLLRVSLFALVEGVFHAFSGHGSKHGHH